MGLIKTQRRSSALFALLLLGCDASTSLPGVTFPGLALNGGNNPPIFAGALLRAIDNRQLSLSANAFDPDGDGLTITYLQEAGPLATERTAFRVGGALNAVLAIPSDGTYVFRVVASDGFFQSDVRLTLTVTSPPPPGLDPVTPIGVGLVRNPFIGVWQVTVAGQILDATGSTSFAQPALLRIEERPPAYVGQNPLVVRLETSILPSANSNTLGAVALTTSAARLGLPSDAVTVTVRGNTIVLTASTPGVPLVAGAILFRPGLIALGAVQAAEVDGQFVFQGDTMSGWLDLVDVSGLILYRASVSGMRRP